MQDVPTTHIPIGSAARRILLVLLPVWASQIGCTGLRLSNLNRPLELVEKTSEPRNDRLWKVEQSVMPYAEMDAEGVRLRHVREAKWRTEKDRELAYRDWEFDWDDVTGVDFIVVPFQDLPMLAHTMLSFRLRDGRALGLSVEARLEERENYDPLVGTAQQYELIYIFADEADLLGLRAIARGDDIYLYPSKATPEQSAALLRDSLNRANQLSESPEFYHSLRNNCTTNLLGHLPAISQMEATDAFSTRLPGKSTDRWVYELGLLIEEGSFEDLRRRAWVSGRVRQFHGDEGFSRKIRAGIPASPTRSELVRSPARVSSPQTASEGPPDATLATPSQAPSVTTEIRGLWKKMVKLATFQDETGG